MKKNPDLLWVFGGLTLFFALWNVVFGIPQSEGFNPSDEGVILAQSFRLLAGEIPHLDFISIRPIGSAFFHSINFLLPGPVILISRWVTLFQYMAYSFIWAGIIYALLPKKNQKIPILLFLSGLIFVLNQNHYNLFPWTTIDALFFFSIGFGIYFHRLRLKAKGKPVFLFVFLTVLFTAYSALCRQTFALPFVVMILTLIVQGIRSGQARLVFPAVLAGFLPFYIYLFVLLRQGAWGAFYAQMTGRTELWETGFLKFWQEFWGSPFPFLALFFLGMALFYRLSQDVPRKRLGGYMLIVSRYFFALLILTSTFLVFLDPKHLFTYSFYLFWLLGLILLVSTVFQVGEAIHRKTLLWMLFVSWISAISLGDNSPVFSTGILAGGGMWLFLSHPDLLSRQSQLARRLLGAIPVLAGGVLVVLSVIAQKNNNYRDRKASELIYDAGSVFPPLDKIRTNENSFTYLTEVSRLYRELGYPKNRTVFIPNGAVWYVLLDSSNPLPVDWMQGPEFVGSEDVLLRSMDSLTGQGGVYFLVEKFNSKVMSDTLIPATYPEEDYPYYSHLLDHSVIVEGIRSDWFELRLWQ